ncbi:hypothetical protein K461DRAFT_129317 [Myriangium duriaei CBS 260.36]|uniref:Pentatricopeptide repeat-containing protein-mitochondrial domain-containing protein n=1 Tax=Myriangium duriaei CBS 260.36 TaxID=1168546 RepID=A0A9P4J758_9PEZI|nr:hypothetical protein K461DRAFT_129317 [Myriangium duriaei CBS 260.36]
MSWGPQKLVARVAEGPAFVPARKSFLSHLQFSSRTPCRPYPRFSQSCRASHIKHTNQFSTFHALREAVPIGSTPDIDLDGQVRYEGPAEGEKLEKLPSHSHLDIQQLPTSSIYDLLRKQAAAGNVDQTRVIVEYLVRQRSESPNAQLYTALILANVNPEQGSAEQITQILREMGKHRIGLDTGICHAVLKVLSVHVDHLLRADILDHMHRRWIELSTEGRHYVAAALLREGDLESGLQAITDLQTSSPELTPAWLVEMAVDLLLEADEVGRALDLIISAGSGARIDALSPAVYHALLDEASMRHHLNATVWAWNSQVAPGLLEPSAGVCLNVLATASHHGDSELAAEAFQRLGALGTILTIREYELMYQSYLTSPRPDIGAALGTLTIMSENGIEPTIACTRPLYTFLLQRPRFREHALQSALQLRRSGRRVPLALLNTLLEVHAATGELAEALEVYRSLPDFEEYSVSGGERIPFANTDTFDLMFATMGKCEYDTVSDICGTATTIWEDQQAMGIPLTEKICARLILIYERSGQTEQVNELVEESRRCGWTLS